MSEQLVYTESKGKIGYVVLNRPKKLNAFSKDMLEQFDAAMDVFRNNHEISVVIIKGNGRAFSVGYDVGSDNPDRHGKAGDVIADRDLHESFVRRWMSVWEYPKPVIAQVSGYALAGGSQLCSCCDVVVTAEDAQFGFPALPLGGGFVGPMWVWHVGIQRAKLMDLTAGSKISGTTAVQWGLAACSFPADKLEEETLNIARGIAKTPLEILRLKKIALNRVMEIQGYHTAQMFLQDQDAVVHTSEGVHRTVAKINELGVKGAVEWFNNQEV